MKTSRRKSKPDLLLVLTLIAGIGVVVSTRAEGPLEAVPGNAPHSVVQQPR